MTKTTLPSEIQIYIYRNSRSQKAEEKGICSARTHSPKMKNPMQFDEREREKNYEHANKRAGQFGNWMREKFIKTYNSLKFDRIVIPIKSNY